MQYKTTTQPNERAIDICNIWSKWYVKEDIIVSMM